LAVETFLVANNLRFFKSYLCVFLFNYHRNLPILLQDDWQVPHIGVVPLLEPDDPSAAEEVAAAGRLEGGLRLLLSLLLLADGHANHGRFDFLQVRPETWGQSCDRELQIHE
jgi:hypothetical protein